MFPTRIRPQKAKCENKLKNFKNPLYIFEKILYNRYVRDILTKTAIKKDCRGNTDLVA